jgi:hypothetical protein
MNIRMNKWTERLTREKISNHLLSSTDKEQNRIEKERRTNEQTSIADRK